MQKNAIKMNTNLTQMTNSARQACVHGHNGADGHIVTCVVFHLDVSVQVAKLSPRKLN